MCHYMNKLSWELKLFIEILAIEAISDVCGNCIGRMILD